ncbi:MAG: hypothetical protein QW303_02250 [Nitrososphaerota archaeon]
MDFFKLHQILNKYPIPDFVKKAKYSEIKDVENIPVHLYGDSYLRMYPCHTAASIVLSAANVMEDKDTISPERFEFIKANILKHAEYFNIQDEVQKIFNYQPKQEVKYALTIYHPLGVRQLFPLRSEKEVKAAADYVKRNWRKIPYEHREEIAKSVIEEANKNKYVLGEYHIYMEKQAGYRVIHKNRLEEYLKMAKKGSDRRGTLEDEVSASIDGLLIALELVDSNNQKKLNEIVKLASDLVCENYEVEEPPEQYSSISTSELKKIANDYIFLNTGSVIDKDDVKLNVEKLKTAFGESVSKIFDKETGYCYLTEFKKFAEGLDEEKAAILEQILLDEKSKFILRKPTKIEIPL